MKRILIFSCTLVFVLNAAQIKAQSGDVKTHMIRRDLFQILRRGDEIPYLVDGAGNALRFCDLIKCHTQ